MTFKDFFRIIKKSSLAAILISFGVGVLLSIGNPIGPFLFAFGLLCVCGFQADLFTGKAGYYWRNKILILTIILIINLIVGWICGYLVGLSNPALVEIAISKIMTWDWSLNYFIKSLFCGMIMYSCVDLYKKKNSIGILYGVPLFIFCGYQHCIANIIILGVAGTFSHTILLCIAGNLIGSIIMNILGEEKWF